MPRLLGSKPCDFILTHTSQHYFLPISGLWGIFWYREVVGREAITKWFTSAGMAVFGILWLSYERLQAQALEAQAAGGDEM